MIVSLDIETVPLPSKKREFTRPTMDTMKFGNTKDPDKKQAKYAEAISEWKQGDSAALSALTGRVAMIGYKADDYVALVAKDAIQESHILKQAWSEIHDYYHSSGARIAGHNIKKFDLPFMVRRSFILGLSVPPWIINELMKYSSDVIIDTMLFWQLGDRQEMVKLSHLCGAFDINVKESPVTGKDFYKWFEKDVDECIKYNQQDVEAVAELCGKLGLGGTP